MDKKNKIGKIIVGSFIFTILIAGSIGFMLLFLNCIKLYRSFDVSYTDLKYEELTFERYEIAYRSRGGDPYEIYFKEYEKPFEVDCITVKKLDKKAIKMLKQLLNKVRMRIMED